MPLIDSDRKRILKQAYAEGVIWNQSEYYDQAEKYLASQWPEFLWPMISDCDFSSVVDLAAGHGRNSERLRGLAKQITIVDINKENVDFCRKRFTGDRKFRFITNDGCGLRELADGSVSLIYCYDAMVHFDSETVPYEDGCSV